MAKPKMLADIIVMLQNVTTAPTAMLPATRSLLTVVWGGELSITRPSLATLVDRSGPFLKPGTG